MLKNFVASLRFISFIFYFFYYVMRGIFYTFKKNPAKVQKQIKLGCSKFLGFSKVSLEVRGLEYTDSKNKNSIIAPNHQSIADVFIIFDIVKGEIGAIAKQSIVGVIPFGKQLFKYGNFFAIDRKNPLQITSVIKLYIKNSKVNSSLLIFPEGTRSRTGELLPFKDGPSFIAKKLQSPVIPAVIYGSREFMPVKKFKCYANKSIYVEFLPPIETKGIKTKELTKQLEAIITERYNYVSSYLSKGLDVPRD